MGCAQRHCHAVRRQTTKVPFAMGIEVSALGCADSTNESSTGRMAGQCSRDASVPQVSSQNCP